jgi:rhodanese-related sulfurtransferase
MKATSLLLFVLLCICSATAQYQYDNRLFKTVYPAELGKALKENKDYLLLDVRSKGEYEDTSTALALNIGRLKGAKHINITELPNRLHELDAYKNKPVFVYCSHSQRSRRASKLLADSGFTSVFNINGGLTSLYYLMDDKERQQNVTLEKGIGYNMISPKELCSAVQKNKAGIFLLDVRPDSVWNRQTSNAKMNATGYLEGSVHISNEQLASRINEIPKGKQLVVIDLFGELSAKAATFLQAQGYQQVSVLTEGVDRWLSLGEQRRGCRPDLYHAVAPFQILPVDVLTDWVNKNGVSIIDLRPADEFNNKSAQDFRNVGRIKGAKNIPLNELTLQAAAVLPDKHTPVLLYGQGNIAEVYHAANELQKAGYTQVSVLSGGISGIRWNAANSSGLSKLLNAMEAMPAMN